MQKRWQLCAQLDVCLGLLVQVHGARLAPGMLVELGWRWRHGPEVVVKVQNAAMQGAPLWCCTLLPLHLLMFLLTCCRLGLHLGEHAQRNTCEVLTIQLALKAWP